MRTRPTYDFTFILMFGVNGLVCLFSIFWNMVLFDLPIDGWGIFLGIFGIINLTAVTIHTLDVWKRRRNFVWETLKNG